MSYINQAYSLTDAETLIIMVDRWGFPNFTVTEDIGVVGTDEATFEGTLQRINRGETPIWHVLRDISSGSEINTLFQDLAVVDIGPLEAIRVSVTGADGTISGRVMQSGAT